MDVVSTLYNVFYKIKCCFSYPVAAKLAQRFSIIRDTKRSSDLLRVIFIMMEGNMYCKSSPCTTSVSKPFHLRRKRNWETNTIRNSAQHLWVTLTMTYTYVILIRTLVTLDNLAIWRQSRANTITKIPYTGCSIQEVDPGRSRHSCAPLGAATRRRRRGSQRQRLGRGAAESPGLPWWRYRPLQAADYVVYVHLSKISRQRFLRRGFTISS